VAKQMSWTDPNTGTAYPAAVFFPVGTYIDFSAPSGNVVFNGYANATAAADALKHALGLGGKFYAPITQKAYPLNAAQVRALAMSTAVTGTMLNVISTPQYTIAETTLDKVVRAPGTNSPDDPGEFVSFFDGATDIVLV